MEPKLKLDPPPVEPAGYREWRRFLTTNLRAACATGNDEGKPYFMFWGNTENMLSFWEDQAAEVPLDDQVIFAWDKDDGVWVLEGSPEIFNNLQRLLARDFLLWHEALERCGAIHYSHWRNCPWSKAAIEASLKTGFGHRPFFERMSVLRTASNFGLEDAKI
ncbi:uncharacterized protein N7473_004224 [Penicillium subrubescens]|uniref:Uncharacterized protein n=1 Tax=Penicillium subrubescens TaxID=1316194 RepID=A0A1Q5UKA5_9EURO|nr:uncharacterized protein N7473_004224 [Penicillium subrubescens]KAJ5907308.1 hypothetical protein N7473_004224 [Penicillium subrubescens]OKP12911.1 hypothetical protein PENSUB_1402 [Penicillium subrubescens]